MKRLVLLATALFSLSTSALAAPKLLDKIVAIVNDKVVTLSEIQRVKEGMVARANISPMLYQGKSSATKDLIRMSINRYLIRAKLEELGYVVDDDQVEGQIKSTEQRLRLTRSALLSFLQTNNITFDEYFEIIRESIEFNIFFSRVIQPLITVTDQEVKNEYFKRNVDNKTLSFKLDLVDFSLPKSKMSKAMLKEFPRVLENLQTSGNLPDNFSEVSTNPLGQISEEGLNSDLRKLLVNTEESTFSAPILIGDAYHVFFVKKKDLVESEQYLRVKESIRGDLSERVSNEVLSLWFQREQNKHFVRTFI